MEEHEILSNSQTNQVDHTVEYFTKQVRKFPNEFTEIRYLREMVKAKLFEYKYFDHQLALKVKKLGAVIKP